MNELPLDRSSHSWPTEYALSYFGLPSNEAQAISGPAGIVKMRELWQALGDDLYHHPLFALRQEWFHTSPLTKRRLPKEITSCTGTLLDYGCGTAEFVRADWIDQGKDAYLMDLPGPNFDYTKAKMANTRAKFCAVNGEMPNKKFDVVVCLDVLEHVRNPMALLKDLWGRLKTGGYALLWFDASRGHPGHLDDAIDQRPEYERWVRSVPEIVRRGGSDLLRKPGRFF